MATNEPMSDDMLTDDEREIITEEYIRSVKRELAEALAEVDRLRAREQAGEAKNAAAIDELEWQRDINQQLGAENEQKQAQIDAMRPVVEAVAQAEAEPMQLYAPEADTIYVAELAASEGWEDEAISVRLPRDTYEQARAFVATHSVTDTATGEAESEGE